MAGMLLLVLYDRCVNKHQGYNNNFTCFLILSLTYFKDQKHAAEEITSDMCERSCLMTQIISNNTNAQNFHSYFH